MKKEKLEEFKVEVEELVKEYWGYQGVKSFLDRLDKIYFNISSSNLNKEKQDKRKFDKIEHIETEAIPIEVEFKRKDGTTFKMKAKKIIRKRVASKKALRAYFHGGTK